MRDYILAILAALWLADGAILLVMPQWTIDRIRVVFQESPLILRWESLSLCGGLALAILSQGLPYQLLWLVTGLAMVLKGLFLWLGPEDIRQRTIDWCLTREPVDYRLWGLGLCTLAVLLLHALGWIGQP